MPLTPFHLAFPVDDLDAARHFYGTVLGCREGRSSAAWIDFDLFGHQIVAHRVERAAATARAAAAIRSTATTCPCPTSASSCRPPNGMRSPSGSSRPASRFVIEPHTRFAGQPGEQSTMFFLDPAGNALEFKSFADMAPLFAT